MKATTLPHVLVIALAASVAGGCADDPPGSATVTLGGHKVFVIDGQECDDDGSCVEGPFFVDGVGYSLRCNEPFESEGPRSEVDLTALLGEVIAVVDHHSPVGIIEARRIPQSPVRESLMVRVDPGRCANSSAEWFRGRAG